MLKSEIQEIEKTDFDLDLLGFDNSFLNDLLSDDDLQQLEEDEVPEVQENTVSVLGDVWQLNDHRLMCGDSTSINDVERLMDGEKADMVFTDPPYNTGMTSQTQAGSGGTLWKGNKKKNEKARLSHMFNDSYTDEEWDNFLNDFCNSYELFSKNDIFIFICLDWRRSHELVPVIKKFWDFKNLIVWDKLVHGLGSDYKYTHEFIHVCKKGKPPLAKNKDGEKEYQDVWRIQRKMGKDEDHATKKPIELCARAIKHASNKGQIVLDLFGGSGSTLIACEQAERKSYMMELDPKYCDVIIRRWQNLTGKEAVLKSNGKTFREVENAS